MTVKSSADLGFGIVKVEKRLGFAFPLEYLDFIQSNYDLGYNSLKVLKVTPEPKRGSVYLAQNNVLCRELPGNALVIAEDGGDFYYLTREGWVYWWRRHQRMLSQGWPTVLDWVISMKIKGLDEKLKQ
ncbi:TPA: SMI1/KNR4 family protein [Photobacterium damselae]